ncbi:hypothetical protein KP79_PYT02858 [Mizuhopecten yessoensis]|uniref:Integrase core domain-containing protein n=1 Tax=Mizuhopecten yessoensis TaxID=6573 RepID=A0A210PJW9_MIZYE|nr:hypothetical protein KP79_PYT02858 [Mizuhopecten yessoensis]
MDEAIALFHKLGLSQPEILEYLAYICNVVISKSTLKRKLGCMGLFRRKNYSDIVTVAVFLEKLLQESTESHGYKLLHLKCTQKGFVVSQETVRLLIHILDPIGIRQRRRGRLNRRIYDNPGPDFVWHIDSYDKLKPYGFCINGAIDGFSRSIIWLEVYSSNSDPALIGCYFMKAVKSRGACPKRVRADRGTENGHVEVMQFF